ncbi:peptide/nickel transport system substrate-binding protein [Ignavigranum ruoffiae]|uniref:Peptide/nickel transport system substrate-binding protein n=1 Tax=Ignavigranum ruoffiae TaxID=89093 RepID=A0A1H9B624_9LACT|nr:ABC transporter substrate-binding protein [Ignavigranum ruoffiae]SEP84133.1 peptide/nickel transport system substrate-binding protein [Ignavigranum ruoffiae]
MKRLKKVLFIVFIMSALVSQITLSTFAQAKEIDVLRVGLSNLVKDLDPNKGIGIASIKVFYNIYDTLLWTDKDGEIVNRIGESWEWLDDETLEVKIREGVTFHNGEELNADDVVFTFDRIVNGYGDGTIRVLYETLDSVEKVDDQTVRFHLNRPDSAFEQRLGSIWGASIVPKDYVEEVGDEAFQTAPIGSGPYKMVEYSPEKYVLERFEDFWGEKPVAKKIEFISVPEASARMTGLITGELDIINDIPTDQVESMKSQEGIQVLGTPIQNIHIYAFNTKKEDSIMSNQKFRQALTMAIDRQSLVDSLWSENAKNINGHQFESYGDLYIQDYPGVKYDPEAAKKLVEESGYDGKEVIKITMKDGYYSHGNEAGQAIVSMWNAIGVQAEVEYADEFSFSDTDIRAWSSASRFDSPLGALWLLFGPGSGPANEETGSWVPTEEFIKAGNTLIDSKDIEEQKKAAKILMEVFDTYVPGTYLYQAEDIYGIRDGLEWDLHYTQNQITPFRAEDLKVAE